ncbi:MAG: glycoside hydrolase family 127 protein [Anaerolineae bacterium]|nr:glycoside hydrolase family 127 protein [Anaerolineae bacterium]NUQ04492.1 glycoside hydrolase family 127 protein [Anaerolineae bacterium]
MTLRREHPVALPLENIDITGGLWGERQTVNRDRTIPAIYRQLKATGRIDAWDLSRKRERPKRHAVIYMFFDSDTGKWVEAAAYSLAKHADPVLEKQVDDLVGMVAKAQQPDGYLNSYFTNVEPGKRWTNLRDWHELYNAGHLLEGAVAYSKATGKPALQDILTRYIDHIAERFGPDEGQRHGYCGHPEIELALVRLYYATGEQRYFDLAKYFIDERGKQPSYFDMEARERGEDPADFWAETYRYCQAHQPIREQQTATGHSVRAGYLYAGVADIAIETGDAALIETAKRLWDDLTAHQMYITGGLGPARSNEGFTFAYDLPNETAYAETCASISLAFWAQRMFHLDPDGRYIDVMERALYNTILAGCSWDGEHFFYANPLASYPNVNPHEPFSGITSARHFRREEWFLCPCCPPNYSRVVGSIGTYLYSTTADTIYTHLYNASRAHFALSAGEVQIEQETNYPWDGEIRLSIQAAQPTAFDLALRIPGWCRSCRLSLNGAPFEAASSRGYVHLKRLWNSGDEVALILDMPVERMMAHPQVREDAGRIALQRGPVVYCLEEVDNGANLANLTIPRAGKLTAAIDPDLFGGVSVITGEAVRVEPPTWSGDLYQPIDRAAPAAVPVSFKAIPYFFWANRQPGEMRVWIREG